VYFVVHFRAISHDLKGIEGGKPDWLDLLKRSYLMLPLAGIVILLVNRYTPTFSAFWGGIIPAVIISFFKKETRINLEKLVNIFTNAAKTVITLSAATAVVGIIVGSFSITGISMTLARTILSFTGGVFISTLIVTMIMTIIIGLGLPTSAAYVLASISAAPALIMLGIDMMHAHLFVFYFGCMSAITPPVATGAFAAAALSGGNPNIIALISVRLAVAGFIVPFIFIYQPDLLLGPNVNVGVTVFVFVVTFIGIIYLCAFFEGAFFDKVSKMKRLVYLVLGLLLIWPDNIVSAIGLALATGVFAMDFLQYRKTAISTRSP
jgi:TRAP transporter 4TM/12TM fusion protein